jgi:hypothetical protein
VNRELSLGSMNRRASQQPAITLKTIWGGKSPSPISYLEVSRSVTSLIKAFVEGILPNLLETPVQFRPSSRHSHPDSIEEWILSLSALQLQSEAVQTYLQGRGAELIEYLLSETLRVTSEFQPELAPQKSIEEWELGLSSLQYCRSVWCRCKGQCYSSKL